jgi:hypothetical protein
MNGSVSELNNLIDLSMRQDFAALLGFTQAELENNYAPFIEKFALLRGTDRNGASRFCMMSTTVSPLTA